MSIVLDLVDCRKNVEATAIIWQLAQADMTIIKFKKAWMKDTSSQLCRLHAC